MARQRAPKKRVPKQERELRKVFGQLTEIVSSGAASKTQLRDLHYARLLHEGSNQVDAYILAYKPNTENENSLAVMASRLAKKTNVVREMDRLRREEDEEANKIDHLEELLMDGPRMRMEMLKQVYLLATNPDTPDAVRLKAALEIGNLKHVDAFCRNSMVIDNSKTQNNFVGQINTDTTDPNELRARLKTAISGFIAGGPTVVPAPVVAEDDEDEGDVIDVEPV